MVKGKIKKPEVKIVLNLNLFFIALEFTFTW